MKYLTFLLLLALGLPALAQAAPAAEPWLPLQFLVGDWVGEGNGTPGQGTGEFSFEWELQHRVLVRRNLAEYPATDEKPAYRHDDLMVIYKDEAGKLVADYWDNEGHVIRYHMQSLVPGAVQFITHAKEGPNYRLTYTKAGAAEVKIKFEIAPPGKPFATYIEASAKKK